MKPIRFYLVIALVVLGDQVSKWAVMSRIPVGESRVVFGSWLRLTHTQNTGGAFSLFQAHNHVFIIVACIAVAALLYAFHRYQRDDLLVSGALALACGGAIGNLIDRLRLQHVVDFFDIRVWPIFNIADSAITVGIVMLACHFLFHKTEQEQPTEARRQRERLEGSEVGIQETGNGRAASTLDPQPLTSETHNPKAD